MLLLVFMFLISLITPCRFGRDVFSFSWTCYPSFSSLLKSWNSLSRSRRTRSFSVLLCTLNGFFWFCYRSIFLYFVRPKVGNIVGLLVISVPPNAPKPAWPADLFGRFPSDKGICPVGACRTPLLPRLFDNMFYRYLELLSPEPILTIYPAGPVGGNPLALYP